MRVHTPPPVQTSSCPLTPAISGRGHQGGWIRIPSPICPLVTESHRADANRARMLGSASWFFTLSPLPGISWWPENGDEQSRQVEAFPPWGSEDRPTVLARSCGVPSGGGRVNPASSVAQAAAEREGGEEVGTGSAELGETSKNSHQPGLVEKPCAHSTAAQASHLVSLTSRNAGHFLFHLVNRRVDGSVEPRHM